MTEPSQELEAAPPPDRFETIPFGWRWINDGFEVAPIVAGFGMVLADMTNAKAALRVLRDGKIPGTMAHLIVRACALALARNPKCHQMVNGYTRVFPGQVDIGLSMLGKTTYAPIVVLPACDRKPLSTLIPDVIQLLDAAVDKEEKDLEAMRRQLWLIPFGFMRRFIIRRLNKWMWWRRRIAGTFQVSTVPTLDVVGSLVFATSAGLATGSIRDRVVAIDGKPAVRPTMWLTISGDHGALDGMSASMLLNAIKDALEGEDLLNEARDAAEARRALRALPAPAPREEGEERPAEAQSP
jgi:pyruvate/2-oxoglutarate dehydrogenase complex dihydrolipoamide acyltransferase (E2) component